jgi:hypothetical protein
VRTSPDHRGLGWFAGLTVILLAVFLWPYAVDGYRFGVGPDVPVYLWWTRVGAAEGLSWIGSRPGAPALAAALAGTLNLNVAAVTAGLASALGVAVGAAAAALVRVAGARSWWLAGLLAGVFAVHLVAGYLANLVLVVPFLVAAACLACQRRRWGLAAMLLAGGGLAHLPFLLVGILILLGAAALAWVGGARDEARDTVLAATAGGLVAGAGVLATLAGPGPIDAPTSKDAYLRRAGLDRVLVDAYRERFRLRGARYVQWVAVPLAIPGAWFEASGFLRRFLASWLVVTGVAVPLGWITGWFPPDRFVTFGFAVPIAAALGLSWLRSRLGSRRALGWVAVIVFAGWMVTGALLAWLRQEPFVSPPELAAATEAMDAADRSSLPGTPVVFVVDDRDATSTFLAARVANITRAAGAPSRAADVYVFLGRVSDYLQGRPSHRGDPQFDAMSRQTLDDIPRGSDPMVLVVSRFYGGHDVAGQPVLTRLAPGLFSSRDNNLTPMPTEPHDRLAAAPSSGPAIAAASIGVLIVLGVLGLGYAKSAFDDLVLVVATAPAFGTAGLTIAAVALDRLGLRLQSLGVAVGAAVLTGIGGLAVLLVQRQRDRQAAA